MVCCVMSFAGDAVSSVYQHSSRILVLHSYEPSYCWTRDLQAGIDSANAASAHPFKLSIEYLDTKRINSDEYLASFGRYLSQKYKNYQFDGVIVTDDNALSFLNQLQMDNLRQLPTVAVGIGNKKASLKPTTDKGIILYEKDYIQENIDLILQLRPHIKNLYYLADRSVTSNLIVEEVKGVLTRYPQLNIVALR